MVDMVRASGLGEGSTGWGFRRSGVGEGSGLRDEACPTLVGRHRRPSSTSSSTIVGSHRSPVWERRRGCLTARQSHTFTT